MTQSAQVVHYEKVLAEQRLASKLEKINKFERQIVAEQGWDEDVRRYSGIERRR